MDHTLAVSTSSIRTFIIPLVDGVRLASVVDACNLVEQGENSLLYVLYVSVFPLETVGVGLTQDYTLGVGERVEGAGLALQLRVGLPMCSFESIVCCPLIVVQPCVVSRVHLPTSRISASTPEVVFVEPRTPANVELNQRGLC